MNFKCDKCDKPATIHITEISDGQKTEKHLCEDCAAAEKITIKTGMPIGQLLEDFVFQGVETDKAASLVCDVCGLSYADFRSQGVLGCPNDYEAFRTALEPLLAQAHEGADQHIGKVPHRAEPGQAKHTAILRLRAELRQAIAAEDYERAARLRDQIKELESP
jgi:protein arginine kinase activator